MKLDILILASHPDDAELCCGGVIAKHVSQGKKVGIVDFTRGELGTRGDAQTRTREAEAASEILGLSVRENLDLSDGFFQNDKAHQLEVIRVIRKYKPAIVLANAVYDRHPDHGKAASLGYDSCFLAGLSKIETKDKDGSTQEAWRPQAVYHYIQSQFISPDLVVDVSAYWDIKMKAVMAYRSQMYDPNSKEPQTFISTPEFLKLIESRAIEFGHAIGVKYAEGFTVRRYVGVENLFDLI